MGVYIDIAMPKTCCQCPFDEYCDYPDPSVYGHHCLIVGGGKTVDPSTKRRDNCPLIEMERCEKCKAGG